MSCDRMESRILPYVDGRLKTGEQRELQAHLAECPACRTRVNEFRAVSELLDELPQIEPSGAFDARVRARVAAEPMKQSWWAWLSPSPRVAFAASLLLLATVWVGSRPGTPEGRPNSATDRGPIIIDSNDLPVLENFDVLANFEPLTDLSQSVPTDEEQQELNQQM